MDARAIAAFAPSGNQCYEGAFHAKGSAMRFLLIAASLIAVSLVAALPAFAQGFTPGQRQEVIGIMRDALRSDPSLLRDALGALQADDTKREQTATQNALARLAGRLVEAADPVAGNPLGDVTIVEFYDTRCPYCRRMMPVTAELLRTDPKVRLVFKDLPILGPASQLESRALLAAQRQGGYFKLQDAVMRAAAPSSRDSLRADADRIGLDGGRLLRDMDDPVIKTRLETNVALAQQLGIQGTPALVIGQHMIPGMVELAELQKAVAEARAGQ